MLVSFSVTNFRSIGKEQTLNLVASKKITDHPNHLVSINAKTSVVRAAVIYGANAAGKSNLVRAMVTAQAMIKAGERPISPVEPFRFDPEFASMPTSFEFRFLKNDRVYTYGFDVKGQTVQAEWLSVFNECEDHVIFERDLQGAMTVTPNVAEMFSHDRSITAILSALSQFKLTPHQLFLNRVKSFPEEVQGETLGGVIRWLTQDLFILLPDHQTADILDRIAGDENFRGLAEGFLRSVGTGVHSLELSSDEVDAAQVAPRRFHGGLRDIKRKPDDPNRFVERQLFAMHPVNGSTTKLPFIEESDGTRQLLHLMPVLASPGTGTKVVVIDELDRSLHPLICWEFIRLFSETAAQLHKQLIVTTHEAHLLNQALLRRDEYWFAEKDAKQQTQLVSLSDYRIRKDLQIAKGYLHGRFGGIPFIGSMTDLEKLLDQGKS